MGVEGPPLACLKGSEPKATQRRLRTSYCNTPQRNSLPHVFHGGFKAAGPLRKVLESCPSPTGRGRRRDPDSVGGVVAFDCPDIEHRLVLNSA